MAFTAEDLDVNSQIERSVWEDVHVVARRTVQFPLVWAGTRQSGLFIGLLSLPHLPLQESGVQTVPAEKLCARVRTRAAAQDLLLFEATLVQYRIAVEPYPGSPWARKAADRIVLMDGILGGPTGSPHGKQSPPQRQGCRAEQLFSRLTGARIVAMPEYSASSRCAAPSCEGEADFYLASRWDISRSFSSLISAFWHRCNLDRRSRAARKSSSAAICDS